MTLETKKPRPEGASNAPTRIAVFDDSKEAIERYETLFKNQNAKLWTFRGSLLTAEFQIALVEFNPQLIVVDLLIGQDREDGYRLIKEISKIKALDGIPIAVCSKLINDSLRGKAEREFCLTSPGVKAVFGKIPDFPPANDLLAIAKKPEFLKTD